MAKVAVPLGALTQGDGPRVCLLSGERLGLEATRVKFRWYPRWISLLVVPAFLVALILSMVLSRTAIGELWLEPSARRRWKLGQLAFGVSVVLAVVGFIAGMVLNATDQLWPGVATMVIAFALPFATWWGLVRGKSLKVLRIDDLWLHLEVPSEEAALAYRDHFAALGTPVAGAVAQALATKAEATSRAPVEARCGVHANDAAVWACGRCGTFFCEACARRPSPGALPLCARCFEIETQSVVKSGVAKLPRLQASGLGLGLLALLPGCWVGGIAGVVVNVVALALTLRQPDRPGVWKPAVGLGLSVGGPSLWLLLFSERVVG